MVALVLSGGCENDAQVTGRFTEEEMARIPLSRRTDLPEPSGGLALSVKSETITVNQIVPPVIKAINLPAGIDRDSFRLRTRPVVREAVISKITDMLLYHEARKKAPENIDEQLETAVENEVNKLLASYGNDYALAQEALAEQGMNWQQYREFQKKLLLTRSYYASESLMKDTPITHSDMLDYYQAMQRDDFEFKGLLRKEDVKWDGFFLFRLIDIRFDKVEVAPGGTPRAAVLQKADELIKKIKQGEDFGELAMAHSHGHRAKMGGLWTKVSEGSSLNRPYDVLIPLAEKMEPGEVAGPVESGGHVFIMKLEEKKKGGVAPFQELQARIELDIQLARRKSRFDKLIARLMSQANITGLDRFIDVCVEKAWHRWQSGRSLSSK